MSAHGKRYRAAREQIDREQRVLAARGRPAAQGHADGAKFDETVEAHFRLGLNVRHADQQLRGTIMLPHGIGKDVRVAVFAEGEKAREAEEAGADIVGSADLATKIEEGFLDFDVAIATPDQMGVVGKLGRVLGPRGLMPNPKTGTVTFDVGKAVADSKAGKLEYRTDRGGNVHLPIGKKSFDERALLENYAALVEEIVRAKPSAAKGRYIKQITLTTTMGPGIHVDSTKTRGHRRGARGSYSPGLATRRLPPKTAGSPLCEHGAEVQPRRFSSQALARPTTRLVRVSSFRGGHDVLKTDKERIVAELAAELESGGDADRRRLPRADEQAARGASRRPAPARSAFSHRQEHADAARRRARPAPTRCSSCSRARPRSRSSSRAAIPQPWRRRSRPRRRRPTC